MYPSYYCCEANYLKTQMLRAPTIFLCLTYSVLQEFAQVSEDSSAPHGID